MVIVYASVVRQSLCYGVNYSKIIQGSRFLYDMTYEKLEPFELFLGTQEELIIPDSWRRPSDIDEPSSQRWETLKMGFKGRHFASPDMP